MGVVSVTAHFNANTKIFKLKCSLENSTHHQCVLRAHPAPEDRAKPAPACHLPHHLPTFTSPDLMEILFPKETSMLLQWPHPLIAPGVM